MLTALLAIFLIGYRLWGIQSGIRNKANLLWASFRYDPWIKKFGRRYINTSNIVWGFISMAAGILILVDG